MGIDYLSGSVEKSDPDAAGIIEDMRAAIRRADNIILGLLDFSAPRDMQFAAENINQVIEQALALTKHEQIGTLVTVERHLAVNLPTVSVDANKITQVFVNLFMNACQAMEDGGRLIVSSAAKTLRPEEVRMEAGTREAARFRAGETVVEVLVDDTGPGIPAEKIHRVFDPFFTTKPTGQGTGLGLTVTRKIIELHGGHLEVHNRPEGGARFVIWFKAAG
jgi:signal transduction histidine kinase